MSTQEVSPEATCRSLQSGTRLTDVRLGQAEALRNPNRCFRVVQSPGGLHLLTEDRNSSAGTGRVPTAERAVDVETVCRS